MKMMNKLEHKGHIVHFVTAFRTGTDRNKPQHHIITEWADGGNLDDLWEQRPKPTLSSATVKSITNQLLGIAEAFNVAHNLRSGQRFTGASYRHGDLKPANILWFTPKPRDSDSIGTLKIGDWGEARNKKFATAFRYTRTSSRSSTVRYQPPEEEIGVSSMIPGSEDYRRSRLYDMWALGCITLEFIAWILYGRSGQNKLNDSIRNDSRFERVDAPYYQVEQKGAETVAWVHKVVKYWIEHMKSDSACQVGSTALGNLLEIVEENLLVINLPRTGGTFDLNNTYRSSAITSEIEKVVTTVEGTPTNRDNQDGGSANVPTFKVVPPPEENGITPEHQRIIPLRGGPVRIRADELCNRLSNLINSEDDEAYWSTTSDKVAPDVPPSLYTRKSPHAGARKIDLSQVDYGEGYNDAKRWGSIVDNHFTSKVFSSVELDPSKYPITTKLCKQCQNFREECLSLTLSTLYDVIELKKRAEDKSCDLCNLLWHVCHREGADQWPEVTFERHIKVDSALTMDGSEMPVLSICRLPGQIV